MTTLAHNLAIRRAAILGCDPKVTIFWIGDAAHEAGSSDHNPDRGGFVHAIDVMYPVGPLATAVVNWAIGAPDDLEYVIHNRTIWERDKGFKPAKYTGTDPHTNHVHISGKHGSARGNVHTGTGYDLAAEAMSPAGSPCEEDDLATIDSISEAAAATLADALFAKFMGTSVDRHDVTLGKMIETVHDGFPTLLTNTDPTPDAPAPTPAPVKAVAKATKAAASS